MTLKQSPLSVREQRQRAQKKQRRNRRVILVIILLILLAAAGYLAYTTWFAGSTPSGAENMTKAESGLIFEELVVGDGATVEAGQRVRVHYTGWLEDGTKFDSSLDRGQPFEFTVGAGRVIKGWDEGVAGMNVGGKRRLIIPPELAYGSRGAGSAVPPNANLIFEVEVLEIVGQ